MSITIGTVIEVSKLINSVSSKLTALVGEPVVLELVKPAIPGMTYDEQTQINAEKGKLIHTITSVVCQHFMTNIVELRGDDRSKPLPDARKIASLLMKSYVFGISDVEIAEAINCERTMVLYNVKEAKALLKSDKKFKFDYNQSLVKLRETIHNDQA